MNDINSIIESLKEKKDYQALPLGDCQYINSPSPTMVNKKNPFEDLCRKENKCFERKWFNTFFSFLLFVLIAVLPLVLLYVLNNLCFCKRNWTGLVIICFSLIVISLLGVILVRYYVSMSTKVEEQEYKLKERLLNEMIRSYNEDREYDRLEYKTKMSLYERYEKARIDEWVHNLEHLRRLQEMEQERLAKVDDKIVELSKAMNKVKISKKSADDKSIEIEHGVLSSDLSDDMKGIIQSLLK